jgi:hypothetical protein
MTEKIKLEDWTYIQGQKITIDGNILIAALNTLSKIKEQETKEVLLLSIPSKITKDKVIYKGATPQQFFSQEPIKGLTEIGALALDLEFTLSRVHQENIELGNATHKDNLLKVVKNEVI